MYSNAKLVIETANMIIEKHELKIIKYISTKSKKNVFETKGKVLYKQDIINMIFNEVENLPFTLYNEIYYQICSDLREHTFIPTKFF